MGLVRLNSPSSMAIDDSRSLACYGRRPAAHRLINFFECPADIIVNVGLRGEGNSVRLVLWSEEVRVRLGLVRVNSLVIMAIDDNRSLACHGRRPAAHRLINFFKCLADIIVSVGLQAFLKSA